jgi:AcrR family transcriptional regulator
VIKNLDRVINSERPRRRTGAAPPARRDDRDDTRTRILDAAVRLFAARGIEAVSVRSILAEAGVNPALAHYHFGSREGLVEELLRTRVAPLHDELLRALDEVDGRTGATLDDVLRAYFTPAVRCLMEQPDLSRLFAQLASSAAPALRALGRESFRAVLRRFVEVVAKRLPGHVGRRQLFVRFFLSVGGPFYLSIDWDAVTAAARRHLGRDAPIRSEELVDELVAFTAAGLRARSAAGGGEAP